jgi:acetyl esterase
VQLAYLGCAAGAPCPSAVEASPLTHVDASDSPFFVAHSTGEIIPLAQSDVFVGALRAAGVDAEFVVVQGDRHSIAMLDDALWQRILDFLTERLAPPAGGTT